MADGSDEDYTLEAYEDDEFDDDDYTETVINAPAPAPSTAAASRSRGSLAAGASHFAGSDAPPRRRRTGAAVRRPRGVSRAVVVARSALKSALLLRRTMVSCVHVYARVSSLQLLCSRVWLCLLPQRLSLDLQAMV